MNDASIHPRKCFLVNVPSGDDRAARHIAAAQCFCERDDVWLQVPMLEAKHFSGAAKTGLHFIGNEERAVLAAKFLRAREEIGLRGLATFALNGLDHKSGDVARTQLSIQFVNVVERHAGVEPFQKWTKAFRKTFAAHQ